MQLISVGNIEGKEGDSIAMRTEKPESVDILGVAIRKIGRDSLTRMLCHLPNGERQGWISYANVDAENLAQEFPQSAFQC